MNCKYRQIPPDRDQDNIYECTICRNESEIEEINLRDWKYCPICGTSITAFVECDTVP